MTKISAYEGCEGLTERKPGPDWRRVAEASPPPPPPYLPCVCVCVCVCVCKCGGVRVYRSGQIGFGDTITFRRLTAPEWSPRYTNFLNNSIIEFLHILSFAKKIGASR